MFLHFLVDVYYKLMDYENQII